MKIKILKPCQIPDGPELNAGDVVDVNSEFADRFCSSGFAVRLGAPEPVQQRDPEVEHRDPTVTKKKRS